MNELTVFQNQEFGRMRTTEIDGKVWFVGKDVARALGYKIDPFKVTICYDDAEFHEKIEEFPLDKVKLSCFPWGYSKKKKDDAAICHVMEEITPCK